VRTIGDEQIAQTVAVRSGQGHALEIAFNRSTPFWTGRM
jgi:hypothetical protein